MSTVSSKRILGIHIYGSSLCIAQIKGYEVERIVVEQLTADILQDGNIGSMEGLRHAIRNIIKHHKLTARKVAFVMPANSVLVRTLSKPVMSEKQFKKAIPFEFQESLSRSMDQYVFDFAVLGVKTDVGDNIDGYEIMAMAALKSTVKAYYEFFKKCGLNMVLASCQEDAISNVARFNEQTLEVSEANKPYCFVDIGYDKTKIHFCKGGIYEVSRTIEVGVKFIETVIARTLDIDMATLEQYKSGNRGNIYTLNEVSVAYGEMANEIKKTVNFYNSKNFVTQLSHVYCYGEGVSMPEFMEKATAVTGLEFRDARDLMPAFYYEAGKTELAMSAVGVILH